MEERFGIGYDAVNKALTRMFHSSVAKKSTALTMTISQRRGCKRTTNALVGLMNLIADLWAPESRCLAPTHPVLTKDKEQAEIDVDNMLGQFTGGEVDSSREGFLAVYQFIKSFTSVGNKAKPNIDLAKQVMMELPTEYLVENTLIPESFRISETGLTLPG